QGRVDDLLQAQKPAVRLVVSDPICAARLLKSLPGVEGVQLNGGNTLFITGVNSQDVMNHLVSHHLVPSEIATHRSDLESLFMDVTAAS
ncbi:MAG: hypothetical protein HY835_13305, partial [Anaerolineae bacterium]|nr:hypothetical protein [Anaerolineae bacterium]